MSRFEDLKQRFDSLEIPSTRRFTTGPEETHEIGLITGDYFDRVLASLRLSQRALRSFFEIEYRVLGVEEPSTLLRITDDFDASLWLHGVQPLASVRNVRDDPNHQVVLFAKYSFASTVEYQLRNIIEQEDELRLRQGDL